MSYPPCLGVDVRNFREGYAEFPDSDDSHRSHVSEMHQALTAFDACRNQVAQTMQSLKLNYTKPASETLVIEHEGFIDRKMSAIHEALSEGEQLRLYRFYLTAVHRNSVIATRFDPQVMSSPERSAAMETEFDEITQELNELINDVVPKSGLNEAKQRLLAADYMWVMTWWIHARRDVISFIFDPVEDPAVALMLGRVPDQSERVGRDLFHQAAIAELEYSGHRKQEPRLPIGASNRATLDQRMHSPIDDWHM